MTNGLQQTLPPSGEETGIAPVAIEEEMRRSYLDYAMSVIVSRALPDVRDGLKPVQRRILYAMYESGYLWGRPYRKCARIVGDVMGKYHPHGDQSIYDALARMAQDFAMRVPLLDGQGNFGSMDGDPPAAMRYTEVRLSPVAQPLLDDIERDTVDFRPNYDTSEEEPEILPAAMPNLLINGAGGIAVGMATNIPPHNPGEIMDACLALIDKPDMADEDLFKIVPGPDFPTGGIILGRSGIASAYRTGRGGIIMRGRVKIEETRRGQHMLVINELPYQVNKAAMIEKIADLVRDKRIEGIATLRDESDRDGVRVVVEIKRENEPDVVLNQLYRHCPLQASFGANMLALDGQRPDVMSLRRMLEAFLSFREEVVQRRTRFNLTQARARAHILAGLAIAVAHIDKVIAIIRAARDAAEAREALMAPDWPAKDVSALLALVADPRHQVSKKGTYKLSDIQARAILDLRLQRLTALGREDIRDEMEKLKARIETYLEILQKRAKLLGVIRKELRDIRKTIDSPRRTEIGDAARNLEDEDLIQSEEMIVTVSHNGYIKRVALSRYRAQRRGGKGRAAMKMREEDFATTLFAANTHDEILFFSSVGKVYKMKTWHLPQGAPQTRGKAMVNLLPLGEGEKISSVMPLPPDKADVESLHVMFATRRGKVRRNALSDFTRVNKNGKIAMKLQGDDRIIGVAVCRDTHDTLLTSRDGRCIRFAVPDVRLFSGRTASGVRGIMLGAGDEVMAMSILDHVEASPDERKTYMRHARAQRTKKTTAQNKDTLSSSRLGEMEKREEFILTVSNNGFGKRTPSFAYRITARGGKGITAMTLNNRTGEIIASFPIKNDEQIMLITEEGQSIRCFVHDVRIAGRATQGVKLFNTEGKKVVSVAHLREVEGDDDDNGSAE